MERQEAVERFTREAEPVLEEGKKLFYRELQEKTEQLSAVICDAIHEIRLETVRLEKEKMMFLHFSLLRVVLCLCQMVRVKLRGFFACVLRMLKLLLRKQALTM